MTHYRIIKDGNGDYVAQCSDGGSTWHYIAHNNKEGLTFLEAAVENHRKDEIRFEKSQEVAEIIKEYT